MFDYQKLKSRALAYGGFYGHYQRHQTVKCFSKLHIYNQKQQYDPAVNGLMLYTTVSGIKQAATNCIQSCRRFMHTFPASYSLVTITIRLDSVCQTMVHMSMTVAFFGPERNNTVCEMPMASHHYNNVIINTTASQITNLMIVYSTVYLQIKENGKTPRHWPLCREFTGDRCIPTQRASNAQKVSIWWRHRDHCWTRGQTNRPIIVFITATIILLTVDDLLHDELSSYNISISYIHIQWIFIYSYNTYMCVCACVYVCMCVCVCALA